MGYLVPFDRKMMHGRHDPAEERHDAKPGDMVVVESTRYRPRRGARRPRARRAGRQSRRPASTPRSSSGSTHRGRAGEEAVEEAKRLGGAVKEKGRARPTPTSGRLTTSSPSTASTRAISTDAITIDKLPNGHSGRRDIADVAHYVPERGRADGGKRTSVRRQCISTSARSHVLGAPTGLCSRNRRSIGWSRAAHGDRSQRRRARYEIHDGVIHSDARMTYRTERDPDGPRSAEQEVRARSSACSRRCRSCSRSERPAQAAAARSMST